MAGRFLRITAKKTASNGERLGSISGNMITRKRVTQGAAMRKNSLNLLCHLSEKLISNFEKKINEKSSSKYFPFVQADQPSDPRTLKENKFLSSEKFQRTSFWKLDLGDLYNDLGEHKNIHLFDQRMISQIFCFFENLYPRSKSYEAI